MSKEALRQTAERATLGYLPVVHRSLLQRTPSGGLHPAPINQTICTCPSALRTSAAVRFHMFASPEVRSVAMAEERATLQRPHGQSRARVSPAWRCSLHQERGCSIVVGTSPPWTMAAPSMKASSHRHPCWGGWGERPQRWCVFFTPVTYVAMTT